MDLSKHLDKATDAIKRRNFALAAQICSQLLAIQPDHGEARRCLREALFKKAQAKPPNKLSAWLGGGVHLATMGTARLLGKHAAAARAAERYLAFDPLNEGVNLRLGQSLERAGCKSSALAVFRAFAEAQPRCAEASRRAGALLYESGDLPAALAMYEQALAVDPRDQEALKARKNLAAEGALRSSGLETATTSRQLIKDAEAQQRLERDQRMQLSADEVEQELTQVEAQLGERPDDVKLLVRAADLRQMADDFTGALDCLERAVRAAPTRSDLEERAGNLRLRLQEQRVQAARASGDEDAARRAYAVLLEMQVAEFRRRVAHNGTDYGLRCDLGRALFESGHTDEAIAELQQGVQDPRRRNEARLLLAKAFRKKELPELALGQLEKCLQEAGDIGRKAREVLYEMGCVAEDLGRPDQALGYFSRVLEQDIGYQDVARKVEQLKASKPH